MEHDVSAHSSSEFTPVWRTERLEERMLRIEQTKPELTAERLDVLTRDTLDDIKDIRADQQAVKKLLITLLVIVIGAAVSFAFTALAVIGPG